MKRTLATCIAGILLPLAACEDPGGDTSYLRASLSGAVVEEYRGNAEWHVGTPGPGEQQFQITSLGLHSGSASEFALTRWDGGRMGEGRYPIGLVDLGEYQAGGRRPKGITLQYFRRVGGRMEQFVADSGFVEVTHSTSERVQGTFSMTGFLYCVIDERIPEGDDDCHPMWIRRAGAPRIRVTGTFDAPEHEPGIVVMD